MSSQSGCVEVPMPSSSVEFANSMQSCVYYESSRCDTEKSQHAHCVLTWPDSVTCVAPCVASWRLRQREASLSGLVAVSEENVLGLVFLDTLRHHEKMTSMRVLVLGMFARRT